MTCSRPWPCTTCLSMPFAGRARRRENLQIAAFTNRDGRHEQSKSKSAMSSPVCCYYCCCVSALFFPWPLQIKLVYLKRLLFNVVSCQFILCILHQEQGHLVSYLEGYQLLHRCRMYVVVCLGISYSRLFPCFGLSSVLVFFLLHA